MQAYLPEGTSPAGTGSTWPRRGACLAVRRRPWRRRPSMARRRRPAV